MMWRGLGSGFCWHDEGMGLSSPLCGNGLCTPLDSGLRRNDAEARIKAIRLLVCVYYLVVIPAKAGIQEGKAGE